MHFFVCEQKIADRGRFLPGKPAQKEHTDNTHSLLCVVAAVAQGVGRC